MKHKAYLVSIVFLAILAGTWHVWRARTPPSHAEPVQIGVLTPLTGPLAAAGDIIKSAADLAVADVNMAGGIDGRTVELVYEDSRFDPKTTTDAYQALKLRGIKYFVVDGSPSVAAIRQNVVDDGNFVIAQAATTPNFFDGQNRTCRIALTARTFGPAIAEYVANDMGAHAVSFLVPNNEYGRGMVEAISDSLKERNGHVVAAEFFATDEQDFRTHITKLKQVEAESDVLFIINNGSTVDPMLTQLHQFGWSRQIVSDIWTMRNAQLHERALAQGIIFADYEYDSAKVEGDSDAQKRFKQQYKERTNGDPVYLAAATYDSLALLFDAFRQVGQDPARVGEYISTREGYRGISGTLSFNDDCEVERTVRFTVFAE